MDKVLSYRDFSTYFLPGLICVAILFYLFPEQFQLMNKHAVLTSFLAIFLSYVAGFLLDSLELYKWVSRRLPPFKDPLLTYFDTQKTASGEAKPNEETSIKSMAHKLLTEQLGDDIVSNMKPTARLFTMSRFIELHNVKAASLVERIVSLDNLSKNLASCMLLVVAATLYEFDFVLSLLAFFFYIFCMLVNIRQRKWFGRTVIRYYVLLRIDANNSKAVEA